MCRRESARQDEEIAAKSNIISDYKTICSQLSQRIEDLQNIHKEELEKAKSVTEGMTVLRQSHVLLIHFFAPSDKAPFAVWPTSPRRRQ